MKLLANRDANMDLSKYNTDLTLDRLWSDFEGSQSFDEAYPEGLDRWVFESMMYNLYRT